MMESERDELRKAGLAPAGRPRASMDDFAAELAKMPPVARHQEEFAPRQQSASDAVVNMANAAYDLPYRDMLALAERLARVAPNMAAPTADAIMRELHKWAIEFR